MKANKGKNKVENNPKNLRLNFCFTLVVTLIIILFCLHSPAYATETATVISTLPASGQQQVDPESVIKVTFDRAMNSATLTPANIVLKDSTQQTVSLLSIYYDPTNNTAVITPAGTLKLSTDYHVVITTGVQDSSNTPLAQDYNWSFRTAAISTHPASGQTQVDPESAIFVSFDQAMNPSTFTPATCSIKEDSTQQIVSLLSIHYDATNYTAVLIPAAPLKLSTNYQAVVTTGVQYSNNTPLVQDYTWSFQTADSPQSLAPSVVVTTPLPGDSLVGLSNRGMDAITINDSTFLLKDSAGELVAAQSITYDLLTRTATFIPTSLEPNQTYQVTITTDVKDSIGEPLAQEFKWSFTTGSTPYSSPHGNYLSNSAACKSCHQTHTAQGKGLLNKSTQTQVCYTCHDGSGSSTNLKEMMNQTGTDQSYHPIMDTGNPNVTSKLECTDCHNPHGDKDGQGQYYPNLLRATDGTTTAYQGVDFCIVCHSSNDPMGWNKSAYKSSTHYNKGMDCNSCHTSHSSPNPRLKTQSEDTPTADNECLSCHGGNPPANYQSALNVKNDFSQTYRHPTLDITGVHKDTETSTDLMSNRHAECVDCHDPHALEQGNITVRPGDALCFKCHTSSQYGTPDQTDNTTSGFSNVLQPNLHNFSGSPTGHLGISCSSCHVSVSHGYFRKGMVGAIADNDPLASASQILAINSGATTGMWEYSSCTTNCHTAGGA